MKEKEILEYDFEIPNRDVDINKALKLSALFAYFQDIACEHASIIGPTIDILSSEYRVAWILMRMRVEIDRLPSIYEKVKVSTWPIGENVLFDRDYTITDKDGKKIVKSASTWILMDLDKRELVKKRPFDFIPMNLWEERALNVKPLKIKLPGEPIYQFEKIISFSDLDYNMHLNNAKYLDYISDSLDLETHQNFDVKVIDINYSNEARLGDKLTVNKLISGEDANIVFVEGRSNDLSLFNSRLELKEKS